MSEENKDENGKTFDMYHFFSRKDVILAAIVILALLIYFVVSHFSPATAA